PRHKRRGGSSGGTPVHGSSRFVHLNPQQRIRRAISRATRAVLRVSACVTSGNRRRVRRLRPGHHASDSSARRNPVKAFRFAPTPFGAHGLDRLADEPTSGSYVMADRLHVRSQEETTMPEISPAPNIPVVIGGQLRVYLAYITTADPSMDG